MVKFNEVTWYSKLAAIIFFLGVFPLLTFCIGVQYEKTVTTITTSPVFIPQLPPRSTVSSPTDSVITWQMASSSNSQYTYPQITNYPDTKIMTKVNAVISKALLDLECTEVYSGASTTWDIQTSVDYATYDIFSVNIHGSYNCGGPYPTNNLSQTLTFDMTNGERILFDTLFINYSTNKNQIISKVYESIIASTTEYIAKQTTAEDNCKSQNTLSTLSDNTHDYRITSTSSILLVRPEYPHVMEACITETAVPIEKILQFASPKSLLQRLK